jgi:hypothetical protein
MRWGAVRPIPAYLTFTLTWALVQQQLNTTSPAPR